MSDQQWTAEDVARVIANPVYATGLDGADPLVSREQWLGAAEKAVAQGGLRPFLERLLDNVKDLVNP